MKAKKVLSAILTGAMLIGSMAVTAFAGETLADGIYVGTTKYSTIAAAQAAAGENGTITVSGTVTVDSRQGISVNNLTVEGVNNAVLTTSETFANGSTTSRKAILSVAAEQVTIKNICFDGGDYGNNLVPGNTADTEFNVLRINSGSTALENVSITGSNRTLLSVGTSSTSATVTATGLYCEAPLKTITTLGVTYADVNVVNGTMTLNSGEVNGFICTDKGILEKYEGIFVNQATDNHFTLKHYIGRIVNKNITSTVDHYIKSYINAKDAASSYLSTYKNDISHPNNLAIVGDMVNYAKNHGDADVKAGFITLLTDAAAENASAAGTLNGYIAQLQ